MGPLEFELGEAYEKGVGTLQNSHEAFDYYLKAAYKEHKLAQAKIGALYLESGTNSAENRIKAHKWLSLAAAQGVEDAAKARDTLARKMTARELADASDRAKRFSKDEPTVLLHVFPAYSLEGEADPKRCEEIRAKAERGDAQAQCDLGDCYLRGEGVTRNAVEAVKWYRKAAQQGFAQAQCYLGLSYEFGNGVTKNAVEAVKWYRMAAEQGNAQAQANLGMCYYNGNGVAKDEVEAVKWYRKAADQGHEIAKEELKALEQVQLKALDSSRQPPLQVLSLTTKVMDTNDIWWRWSYQLKVRNNTEEPVHEFPGILFLDAQGFIIERKTCEVKLSPHETKTVLGTELVNVPGAARVKTVKLE
jgi:uncharacterized protein